MQDSKPADARDPRVRARLHAAHPAAVPAVPLEAAEPALQLTREQLQQQEVVAIVSAHHRGTAAGPSGWTFKMIYAACQSADATLDVTLELVNLILSGELPREAFLLDGLLIGVEKPGGGVRPIAISETSRSTVVSLCGALRAADMRAWHRRWPGPTACGRGHTRRHGDCGARACVGTC